VTLGFSPIKNVFFYKIRKKALRQTAARTDRKPSAARSNP
jgi:hypothetical protein